MENLFLIDKIDGLSEDFSKLVSMMNYARFSTLRAVQDLTTKELDYLYEIIYFLFPQTHTHLLSS